MKTHKKIKMKLSQEMLKHKANAMLRIPCKPHVNLNQTIDNHHQQQQQQQPQQHEQQEISFEVSCISCWAAVAAKPRRGSGK